MLKLLTFFSFLGSPHSVVSIDRGFLDVLYYLLRQATRTLLLLATTLLLSHFILENTPWGYGANSLKIHIIKETEPLITVLKVNKDTPDGKNAVVDFYRKCDYAKGGLKTESITQLQCLNFFLNGKLQEKMSSISSESEKFPLTLVLSKIPPVSPDNSNPLDIKTT